MTTVRRWWLRPSGAMLLLVLTIIGADIVSGRSLLTALSALTLGPSYHYTLERPPHTGTVRAVVGVRWHDHGAVARYRQANTARIHRLIHQRTGALVPVTITFTTPVPVAEVAQLAAATSLEIDTYTLVQRSPQGERLTRTLLAHTVPLGSGAAQALAHDYAGVLVMDGQVLATEASLGRLRQDTRIYLADTTAVEVRERLRWDSRSWGKPVDSVTLETPFWTFPW